MLSEAVRYHQCCEALANLYLEDSYVLDISEEDNSIRFDMEFVLTEKHKLYHPPKEKEQYCYKRGQLEFLSTSSSTILQLSNNLPSIDANGEKDIGNIDYFVGLNDKYFLEGDWGSLDVVCENVSVKYYAERTAS